ncbi:MAG: hypothetical protein LHW56_01645 [Candidatus Cloacimonetes bacterium]|nr:hypothetical protein [Candidatus Cloacimonadota bacterium]MDY0171591.1 hypothetical protein [Candidatus Cloacimonadaceae bacterium]
MPTALSAAIGASASPSSKEEDLRLWKVYHTSRSPKDREALLKRLDPILQSQVNKWAGPVPRGVLENEAMVLAAKALDTYNPNLGAALSTHIVNNLAPISRLVYTYQNAARIPENITLKLRTFNDAKERLTVTHGFTPTVDQLHQELGWSVNELNRVENSMRNDLVESVGGLDDRFFSSVADDEEDMLEALYFDLLPEEKKLFELVTGFHGRKVCSNPEIMQAMGWSQAQLSYKKRLLTKRIAELSQRYKHA